VGHKPTLARVGYLPENHRFPRYLTARQTLEFFAGLSGIDRAAGKYRAGELLEIVGMSSWADRLVGTYSKGMMQRVGLAQAMVNDPDLILLDEPTDGVDPQGRKEIRDVLAELRQQGKTVFINSHLLSELEMVCDRVAILVNGAVAKQGTFDELSEAQQRYEIEVAAADGSAELPLATAIKRDVVGNTLRLFTTNAEDVQPVIDLLRQRGQVIRRVELVRPSLEEMFIQTVGSQRRDAGARL
jgi:ABC-2 type transport system ATP-binding protein